MLTRISHQVPLLSREAKFFPQQGEAISGLEKLRNIIIKTFPVLVVILIVMVIFSRLYSPGGSAEPEPDIRITANEASQHMGALAEVCGFVATAAYMEQAGGSPTFINFERDYPDQVFTVVIRGKNRHEWRHPPEQLYPEKNVCVTGRIQTYKNSPQIIIQSPASIRIQD